MNQERKVTIAILTGGGDVPGLNPCIKSVVYRGIDEGMRVVGIRRGWDGLLAYNPDDPASFGNNIVELNKSLVRTIDRSGGTFLHTSRTNPSAVKFEHTPDFLKNKFEKGKKKTDFTSHILSNLEKLRIDVVIPIGGDDTLSYGVRMYQEGIKVIAIPKTMDNDVPGTDYCIGFSTCLTRTISLTNT